MVASFPYEYFRRKSRELEQRVGNYKTTIEQLSSVLSSPSQLSPSSILPTLKAQHASLMSLAGEIAGLESELKGVKDMYRAIWREKTGRTGIDPFRLNGGGGVGTVERGVGGMEIR